MKPFKQQYLVLSAQSYRIADEKTGQVTNEGISIWYVPDDELAPMEDPIALQRGQIAKGIKVAKMSLPVDRASKLQAVPGMYDVSLTMTTVAQKQQIRPVDLDFLGTVKLQLDGKPK